MNFGEAIDELKHGKRVARQGWNGKGMWLILVEDWTPHISEERFPEGFEPEYDLQCDPFILMFTANQRLAPWNASQADAMASDWVSFEERY